MQKNMIHFIVLLLALAWIQVSCGDDDDPLAAKCEQVCRVDDEKNPCSAQKHFDKCVADCRSLAGDAADRGYKPTECGLCIAEQFYYTGKQCKGDEICTFGGEQSKCEPAAGCSAELEACFDAQQPTGIDIPECTDLCIEVD